MNPSYTNAFDTSEDKKGRMVHPSIAVRLTTTRKQQPNPMNTYVTPWKEIRERAPKRSLDTTAASSFHHANHDDSGLLYDTPVFIHLIHSFASPYTEEKEKRRQG
jgi:hypothetical protein